PHQVEVHDIREALGRHVLDGPQRAAAAGIVDQRGDRPERRVDRREHGHDIGFARHVALYGDGLAALRPDGVDDVHRTIRGPVVVDGDPEAPTPGQPADRSTDASAAARDKQDPGHPNLPWRECARPTKETYRAGSCKRLLNGPSAANLCG